MKTNNGILSKNIDMFLKYNPFDIQAFFNTQIHIIFLIKY